MTHWTDLANATVLTLFVRVRVLRLGITFDGPNSKEYIARCLLTALRRWFAVVLCFASLGARACRYPLGARLRLVKGLIGSALGRIVMSFCPESCMASSYVGVLPDNSFVFSECIACFPLSVHTVHPMTARIHGFRTSAFGCWRAVK